MSARVSISRKTAEHLVSLLELIDHQNRGLSAASHRAKDELRAAMKPRRSVLAHRKVKAKKRRTKKAETASIREAVMKRADGKCELCSSAGSSVWPLQLHHVFGRVRVRQSERNCLAVCATCHDGITRNNPSAMYWLERQAIRLYWLGFKSEADALDRRIEAIRLSRPKAVAP